MSETLSTLGQHFGQLLELALTREVQVSAGWAWTGALEWTSGVAVGVGQRHWARLGEALTCLS